GLSPVRGEERCGPGPGSGWVQRLPTGVRLSESRRRSQIMSRLKLYVPVGVFLVLALLLWRGLYHDPRTLPSVLIDMPHPEFELPTIVMADMTLCKEDLPEEPFLRNIWGNYCLPCLQENPIFMAAAE